MVSELLHVVVSEVEKSVSNHTPTAEQEAVVAAFITDILNCAPLLYFVLSLQIFVFLVFFWNNRQRMPMLLLFLLPMVLLVCHLYPMPPKMILLQNKLLKLHRDHLRQCHRSSYGLSRQWQYYHALFYDSRKYCVSQISLSLIDRGEKGELVYRYGNTIQQQTVILEERSMTKLELIVHLMIFSKKILSKQPDVNTFF